MCAGEVQRLHLVPWPAEKVGGAFSYASLHCPKKSPATGGDRRRGNCARPTLVEHLRTADNVANGRSSEQARKLPPNARNVTRATSDCTRSVYALPTARTAYTRSLVPAPPTPGLNDRSCNGRRLLRNRTRRGALPVPCCNDHHPIAAVIRGVFIRLRSFFVRSTDRSRACRRGAHAISRRGQTPAGDSRPTGNVETGLGTLAAELRWSAGDVFDVPREGGPGGLVWRLGGERVQAMGADHVALKRRAGSRRPRSSLTPYVPRPFARQA